MSHDPTSTTRPFSKKFSMLGAALSLLTPAFFAACGNDSPPANTVPPVEITVGAMLPRTGPNANSDWISAVELAVHDMNLAVTKAKMARPITFKLDEVDTASNEAMAFAAMGTYQAEGAKVVITEASNAAIGANKWNYTAENVGKELPVISFTATSSSLNKATQVDPIADRQAALRDDGNWFFRTCPASDALSALRLAKVFNNDPVNGIVNGDVNNDKTTKIVWIGSSDSSTVASINGDKTAFNKYATDNSIAYIAESVVFDPGATPETFDYGLAIGLATDNKANDGLMPPAATTDDILPDLIINKALPTIAIPFIKAYKQNTLNTIKIFQDGSFRRNTLLASLGSAADHQVGVSNIAYEATPSGETFKNEQQAKTLWAPAAYEAQGYDAAVLAMLAVIKASIGNTDGEPATITGAQVQAALGDLNHTDATLKFYAGTDEFVKAIKAIADSTQTVDYSGASGGVNFDERGNVYDRAVLWEVLGGQFSEREYFACDATGKCTQTAGRADFGSLVP
jgi:hypothetical protein